MKKCYTYDDVNIIPKYSDIKSRSTIELRTRFTKNINIDIPIISAPMDTITGFDMAFEMLKQGGVGVIHRFMSIEEQCDIIGKINFYMDDYDGDDIPYIICAAIGVSGDWFERAQELALKRGGCTTYRCSTRTSPKSRRVN